MELLLEREEELSAIRRLTRGALAGGGGLAFIEGPAGIGKTRLIEAARQAAAEHEVAVFAARATELERGFAFGVVRQLLEPRVRAAPPAERRELFAGAAAHAAAVVGAEEVTRARADLFATLHALYWVVANLAERGPGLVILDDAQWADAPSLRFIAYLARRLEGMPVAILIGHRPEPGADPVLRDLATNSTVTLSPRPLSEAGTRSLLSTLLGRAAEEFASACHRAAAGNPFLLHALGRAIAEEDLAPTTANAARISSFRPIEIQRTMLSRLERLGPAAVTFATALAVLGERAELNAVAAVADMELAAAADVADRLRDADLVTAGPLIDFVHPLVRSAFYSQVPPNARALRHRRAAEVLDRRGVPTGTAAAHLLNADARGEAWAVEVLLRAAGSAASRGAPAEARPYLERALAEPPPAERRSEVLLALGRAEWSSGETRRGVAHVDEAIAASIVPRQRALAGLELARRLSVMDQPEEAVAALDRARLDLGDHDPDLTRLLEAELVGAARLALSTLPRALEGLAQAASREHVEGQPDALLDAYLAFAMVAVGAPAAEAAGLAERALDGDLLTEETVIAHSSAIYALIHCGRLERARRAIDSASQWARERGSILVLAHAAALRGHLAHRQGDLPAAEVDLRLCVETMEFEDWGNVGTFEAMFVEVLLESGAVDEALEKAKRWRFFDDLPDLLYANRVLLARARLHAAAGRLRDALDDLLACGSRLEPWSLRNPSLAEWRPEAAILYARLGEPEPGRQLAEENVEIARGFGTPQAVGGGLHALGVATGGSDGLCVLEEAVQVLDQSDARLALARALFDYGGALRRAGQRRAARDALERGLETARRCGAAPFVERFDAELRAAGAKPRRLAFSGVESLTASERRVAELAATGLSNPEVAQELFITRKTVEMHLGRVFRKLDITARTELPEALGTDT